MGVKIKLNKANFVEKKQKKNLDYKNILIIVWYFFIFNSTDSTQYVFYHLKDFKNMYCTHKQRR